MDLQSVWNEIGIVPFEYGDNLSFEFVYSLITRVADFSTTEEIPTAYVRYDKQTKKFKVCANPTFIEYIAEKRQLNDVEKKAFARGILKHEMLHLILQHLVPDPSRNNHVLANVVQDALINDCIPEFQQLYGKLKRTTPEKIIEGSAVEEADLIITSGCYECWEDYYDALKDKLPPAIKISFGKGSGDSNEDEDSAGSGGAAESPDEIEIPKGGLGNDYESNEAVDEYTKKEIEDIADEFAEALKRAGNVHSTLIKTLEAKLKVKKLRLTVNNITHNVFRGSKITTISTVKRPHRRFEDLPGYRRIYVSSQITALLDTSGSIKEEDLQTVLGSIQSLCRAYGYKLNAFTYDTGLQDRIKPSEIRSGKFHIHAGGGTDLRNTLKELIEKDPKKPHKAVIVFTDGYDSPPSKSEFPCSDIHFVFTKDHSENFRDAVSRYAKTYVLP